jgi:hypothetical protein
MPRREVAPRRGALPPAALALCRLLAEAWGEEVWRAALAEVEAEAATDALQVRNSE